MLRKVNPSLKQKYINGIKGNKEGYIKKKKKLSKQEEKLSFSL